MTTFANVDDLKAHGPGPLGAGEWFEITQERINQFAEATGDHQWIHVDEDRASKGPFGATIAHGYLTLSLISKELPGLIEVRDIAMGINYGLNKVRNPAPVPVGSRVRMSGDLQEVTDVGGGAVQAVVTVTVELEGSDKPACVAETISRYYPNPA